MKISKDNKIRITECIYKDFVENHYGVCLACGEPQEGCDPDGEKGICEICKSPEVYGAEQLLLLGLIQFVEKDWEVNYVFI